MKKWNGDTFDFHGACDLVLLDNPTFHNGTGMTIHIRTKIVAWWSFIHSAVIRIGEDTLEVTGGTDRKYLVNGVEGDNASNDFLFSSALFKVHQKSITSKKFQVRIDLSNGDAISFGVSKDFVRVNVHMREGKFGRYKGSVGLMGTYPSGMTHGRDGKTVFTDMNAFGQEWQVLEAEPKLFQTLGGGPQAPNKCAMPTLISTEQKKRRLGESMLTREDAELACAGVVDVVDRAACASDVLATNDIDLVGSYD